MSGVNYHAWTHRPKSQGGTDPMDLPETQWIRATSNTNLGTSFTAIDWTESTGSSCYTSPTFAINASSNLEIGRDGMYDLMLRSDDWVTNSNEVRVLVIEGYRNAGAVPIVLGASSFISPVEVRVLQRYDDPGTLNSANLFPLPEWYTPLAYFDGDISSDGATEIEFRAFVLINGSTGTADSNITFDLICRRIGPPGIPPP